MKLKSLTKFQAMPQEFADLPNAVQKKMEELDSLLDEQENGDDSDALKSDIETLDVVVYEMLDGLKKPEEVVEEEVEEVKEEPKAKETPDLALPEVDLSKSDDNVAENAHEPETKSESSPYFWMQS